MSVTVNKLDSTDEFADSSEFDIETLDDITSQKGGASTNNNTAGLSVPSNNTMPASGNNNKPASNNTMPASGNNNKPGTNNTMLESGNNNKPGTNNTMLESGNNNKPPSANNLNKLPSMNKPESNTIQKNNTVPSTNIEEPAEVNAPITEEEPEVTAEPIINNVPKTKKAKPAGGKKGKKKTGQTKKKMVVAESSTEPLNNDVKPQVEIGNDRGTMTIKYASSKTMTPLYSTGRSNHMDLTPIREAFQASYNTVLNMSNDDLMALRREMLNTEFTELGADSLIHGLLHLLDDHDTKKLTLRMMLARGELKIGA